VTINKYADIDLNATIRGIYAVIAEKVERIGIEYPPVLFRFGVLVGPVIERSLHVPIAVDPKWEIICPWEQWYRPIPGGVQKQAQGLHWAEASTIGFPARHRLWWWIEALVITGHLGPERTPVNLQKWQPGIVAARPHYKAGRVVAVARMGGYADAARVCFEDIRPPRIHTGGDRLDPVIHWRDPSVSENVTISGQASAVLGHGVVVAVGQPVPNPTFGTLHNQVLARSRSPQLDSGAFPPTCS
jgi:hypothetical protein